MSKVMLGVLAGVFCGAFVMEVLHRKRPGLVEGVEGRAKQAARDFGQAFTEGYRGNGEAVN